MIWRTTITHDHATYVLSSAAYLDGVVGQVFISSASGEHLTRYRQAAIDVCHRLQLIPINMEEFLPESTPPLDVCLRKVDEVDVFVLLLAHRYGSCPRGHTVSYTELEYQRANERGIPIHVFIVDPDLPWPPSQIDHDPYAQELARFAAVLREAHLVRQLGGVAQFREDLLLMLSSDVPAGSTSLRVRQSPAVVTPPDLHAVPPYVSNQPFVGRRVSMSILDEWATSDESVLVVEGIGGLGKSALTWNWLNSRASSVIDGLAGRLWWSFYDGSASMVRFMQEAAAYLTESPLHECKQLVRTDLVNTVLMALRRQPFVLVLDGFERMLTAYQRFDPTKLRDDEVDHEARSLIDPFAHDVLRSLVACAPSKVLISSRLTPDALENPAGLLTYGVRRHRLPGLTEQETNRLVSRLEVVGEPARVAGFFDRLGNHPLLIGAVCGMVRDYRSAPGNFDAWVSDPAGGAGLRSSKVKLSERQTRVLSASFSGLAEGHRRVLEAVSVLPGGSAYAALKAVNPFRPNQPSRVNPWAPFGNVDAFIDDRIQRGELHPRLRGGEHRRLVSEAIKGRRPTGELMGVGDRVQSVEAQQALAALDRALADLENRGLLLWDRSSNTYDLHPVVRAFAHDQMADDDRVQVNIRVRDHFTALPNEDLRLVSSVEDMQRTITLFRAQVGAGDIEPAAKLYASRLEALLYWHLGANSTIIELLEPLMNVVGAATLAGPLGAAYHGARQLDSSLRLQYELLGRAVTTGNVGPIAQSLDRLAISLIHSGQIIAAQRALAMAEALTEAGGIPSTATHDLHRASLAVVTGDLRRARAFLAAARGSSTPSEHYSFDVELELGAAEVALLEGSITLAAIDYLSLFEAGKLGQYHAAIAGLRCSYWLKQGRLGNALDAADEYSRRCRDKGLRPVKGLAMTARVLAQAGNVSQALVLVEEALAGIDRLHVAVRPYGAIAEVLVRVGDPRAIELIQLEYRRAWCDGPPHCQFWDLEAARRLLDQFHEPHPALPIHDPATFELRFEGEIRAVIASQRR